MILADSGHAVTKHRQFLRYGR